MQKMKLAIIGCGAVANAHLPVAQESGDVQVAALVDKSLSRARELADQYNVGTVLGDYREVVNQVDAAIVALPHHLHAPVTIELLRQGMHVLVEKPMALSAKECDEMVATARQNDTVLAVGQIRRFYGASQFIKHFLQNKYLGNIIRFDYREGSVYSWPVASDFMFSKKAGGGVLADTGAHALDTLLWWLGDYESLTYYDDAFGGVEADCEIHLRMKSGAAGMIELSRTRELRNTCIIEGEQGRLEIDTGFNPEIRLTLEGQEITLDGRAGRSNENEADVFTFFRRQLADFVNAIREGREAFISGTEGKRTVALMEACYGARQSLRHPWVFPEQTGFSTQVGRQTTGQIEPSPEEEEL